MHPIVAVARLPLELIPKSTLMPILTGPAQGMRWRVGAGNHECWIGTYEFKKVRRFAREVQQGHTVYDLGAHVGYYTLVASKLVGAQGHVVAVEPMPNNFHGLIDHIRANRASNVQACNLAVGDHVGRIRMLCSETSYTGHIDKNGDIDVEMITLDMLAESFPPPQIIKMDIEGAELNALQGGAELLKAHKPTLYLSTHHPHIHEKCCKMLAELNYDLKPLNGKSVFNCTELVARSC